MQRKSNKERCKKCVHRCVCPYKSYFDNVDRLNERCTHYKPSHRVRNMGGYAVGSVVCDWGVFDNGTLKLITNYRNTAEKIVKLLEEDQKRHLELNRPLYDDRL